MLSHALCIPETWSVTRTSPNCLRVSRLQLALAFVSTLCSVFHHFDQIHWNEHPANLFLASSALHQFQPCINSTPQCVLLTVYSNLPQWHCKLSSVQNTILLLPKFLRTTHSSASIISNLPSIRTYSLRHYFNSLFYTYLGSRQLVLA